MNKDDAEFFKKLRYTFKIEANEHLRTISLMLLELEKKAAEEDKKRTVETIHREFHSLKGASRAVGIKEIEAICHTLENIFSGVKKEKINLDADMFDIFNEALDTIEDILSLPEDEVRDISIIINKLSKLEVGNSIDGNGSKVDNMRTEASKDIEEYKQISDVIKKNSNTNVEFKDIEITSIIKTDRKIRKHDITKITENKKSDIIRVSKDKLDSLLLQGEELLYTKLFAIQRAKEIREIKELLQLWKKEKEYSHIKALENNIENLLKSAQNDAKTIEAMLDNFIEDIKDMMMLPFSYILEMFPKMVRDLSRSVGKEIKFISSGTELEIDRRILEELKDPLMHIIRNCIDHGIEEPEKREKLRKDLKGTITLSIAQISSDRVKIDISDDGAGIDINKVRRKAVKDKLFTQEEIKNIDDETVESLIFKSGISTSDIVTDISGRGLGLAIVSEKVQKLEGSIKIKSESGIGTTFSITIPITISTNRGIIVKVAKQMFIIPTGKVEKAIRIKSDEIKVIEGRATILLGEDIIPIVNLRDILELNDKGIENNLNDIIPIVIISQIERKIAIRVDEIVIEQEVLVKRFNRQLKRVRNIAGATILGSGVVVPILDVQDLIKSSIKHAKKSANAINSNNQGIEKKSIVVVEDSITSRTLLKNILENYGYSVKTAVDGLEGWKMLKSEKFDLVITDIEMPVMDGFELTMKIRNDEEISELPVILVTSLESREDKERGIDVGASAYIVKTDFQQSNLLEIIKRLI